MHSSLQLAYLEAMDIAVWSSRKPASRESGAVTSHISLKLGPGNAGSLLICQADTDSAGRLANDISRTLGRAPVWAWPSDDTGTVDLPRAVDDKLFTTVAIFGEELAMQLFEGELPDQLNSAKLVLLPSLRDIQNTSEARRNLWATLCLSGMLEQG
ncbi:MAG: hypothetical protein OEU84_01320 [Xanthomonadales bacterium]|nr:hypothetical protein [Xanthomonadales bacterium]MDH4018216.1 hypothetical protein [Xanthomonadales bacterium]